MGARADWQNFLTLHKKMDRNLKVKETCALQWCVCIEVYYVYQGNL